MHKTTTNVRLAFAAVGTATALLIAAPVAQAFNFGDMMSPGRWFGGNNNDDDYYYDGPYGAGPYGGPYGAPFGAPGYGYGYAPGAYGVPPVAPGYVAPAVVPAAPAAPASTSSSDKDREIEALKRRIDQLEASRQGGVSSSSSGSDGWPAAPAFRPMDQY